MSSVSGKKENPIKSAMESKGFDQKYSVKKLIMTTSLYSVYLISEKEKLKAEDMALLIEHLPAKEPSAHLLPIKIKESAPKTETMREITDAVHDYFAQNNHNPI